jgi:hypothetical protein
VVIVSELYRSLTNFIPLIKNITYGKWYPEKQSGDGSAEHPFQMPFVSYDDVVEALIQEVYAFVDANPEYELRQYNKILEKNHIEWESNSMLAADVSQLDGQCVMALLLGAIRAERFCDGALLGFFEKGCVGRWLERLKEIDESGVKGVYEEP